MPLSFLGSVIGAGAQYAGAKLAYKGQKEANQTNVQLAKDARNYDYQMWNEQNAYNTPQMQMQRLQEAGLNPNLVYGSGAGQTTASSPQKAPVPQVNNEMAAFAQMNMTPMISLFQDWQVKKAQIDNLRASAEATKANTMMTNLKRISQDYTNRKLGIEFPYHEILTQSKMRQARSGADISSSKALQEELKEKHLQRYLPFQMKNIDLKNQLLQQQGRSARYNADLDQQLKQYGVTTGDQLWQRLLTMMLNPFLSKGKRSLNNFTK